MWVVGVIFPKIPTIFPNVGKNEGFFWGKGTDFSLFLYFLALFFFFFLLFPKKCPIFPKITGFSGKVWEKDCFALVFAVLLHRRRNKTTPKWFGDLETSSSLYNYECSDYESGEAGRGFCRAEPEE